MGTPNEDKTRNRILNRLRKLGFGVTLEMPGEQIPFWIHNPNLFSRMTINGRVGYVYFGPGRVNLLCGDPGRNLVRTWGVPQSGQKAWAAAREFAREIVEADEMELARRKEFEAQQVRERDRILRLHQLAADRKKIQEDLQRQFARILQDRGLAERSSVRFIFTPHDWNRESATVSTSVSLDLGDITPEKGARLVDALIAAGLIRGTVPPRR